MPLVNSVALLSPSAWAALVNFAMLIASAWASFTLCILSYEAAYSSSSVMGVALL